MDPNKALKDFWREAENGHYKEACLVMFDLVQWLANGGFAPNWDEADIDYEEEN